MKKSILFLLLNLFFIGQMFAILNPSKPSQQSTPSKKRPGGVPREEQELAEIYASILKDSKPSGPTEQKPAKEGQPNPQETANPEDKKS